MWPATAPAPAAGAAAGPDIEWLLLDLALRQRLFQFGDARVGYLGAVEAEILKAGQPLEVHQSRVGDLFVVGQANLDNLTFRISPA